nr:ubx domain-containing protein 2 [Quercus suber]
MDEQISNFVAFTGSAPEQAQQYLTLTDGNLEQAVELFFSNPDLGSSANPPARAPSQPSTSNDPITIDDDDDDEDDDVQMTGSRPAATGHSVEDDEAMARRLQEEMYGARGGSGGAGVEDLDEDGVRAPMARTTETLVGPASDWRDDPSAMNQAVFEQLANRQRTRRGPPGIFNQRETPSIWAGEDPSNPEIHRQILARATGGASEATSKSTLLADLFRPPFDLIANLPWSAARDEGKDNHKWILVNVQDPSIFDCQVLNRDIWKNSQIKDTIKEHFIFLQYNKDDSRGQEYIQYYFAQMRDLEDAYPHIAIVDPRTGEQVKTWSGAPSPKAADFLMDLHEFLDRYSLSMEKKNPVQAQRKERKKDVAQMSEEEMLQMALQNSLDGGSPSKAKDDDPDALTRPADKGKRPAIDSDAMVSTEMEAASSNGTAKPVQTTPFSLISDNSPHEEPTSTGPDTTRIQFRYSGGRIVRRFDLTSPVRRIYEWLKAAPLEGKEGASFELISMGKNLIDMLDTPIAEAGLKNGTVMVEFIEED